MKSERWQELKRLLEQVIAMNPAERHQFLDVQCNGDPDLRSEVESLLLSHEEAGTDFLKEPMINLTARAEPAASTLTTGQRVGVYRILGEIGHGGMGAVYRAARADGQYVQDVAIKLVRGGLNSPTALERFRTERQILATLEHPNIARLLDGGTTDDGLPYLVMELIDGEPIDRYCDRRKLSVSERLRLFRAVCEAVQYAHQRLVIHRDLKPSNILVTQAGVPKLLDFGIAKVVDTASNHETTVAWPMTPQYASPEQIRGETISTASDVYSLGVVLYQLLTGRSPYPADSASAHGLAMAICEWDPDKPSTVVIKKPLKESVSDTAATTGDLSSSREGSPARLRRRLTGDLDHIVMKALRKESSRRYSSAEQLSDDLRRHLEGLTVTAVKGSFRYRAGKFMRRNKGAIAATGLVFCTLIVGVLATIRQARIARQQAAIANQRFNDVRKLANSLIFEIHDSIQDLPGATPSRKLLLDRAVEYLDKISKDVGGDIDLQRELAWGYERLSAVQGDTSESNLGQIGSAEASIRKSMALFEAVAKANPTNLNDQLNLAMAYRRQAFTDIYEPSGRKEIDQALAVTQPLMQTEGRNLDVRSERALELQILGDIQDATGNRLEAVGSYRDCLELRRGILSANPEYKGIHRGVAKSTIILGYQLGRIGNRNEALQLLNQGIRDYEGLAKAGGNPDVVRELAVSQMRRAEVKLMNGDNAAALAEFRQSRNLVSHLARLDPQNKMLQSDMLTFDFDEGRTLTLMGDKAGGLRLLQHAAEGFRELHLEADTGPGTGALEAWLAEAYARSRDLPDALKHYQAAAAALKSDLNKYDDARCDLAMVEAKMGTTQLRMRRLQDASETLAASLELADPHRSIEHMDLPALTAAAEAYAGMGDVWIAKARAAGGISRSTAARGEAISAYANSLKTWKVLPASKVNGNGYSLSDPLEVSQKYEALNQATTTY